MNIKVDQHSVLNGLNHEDEEHYLQDAAKRAYQ